MPRDIPVGNGQLLVSDIGEAKDASAIQTNIVRVDGQHSVYLPILKQGGGSNTIAVVNGIRTAISELTARAELAHKEGRNEEGAEIERRIQAYRDELGKRP